MKFQWLKGFLRDCALASVASYVGIYLFFGLSETNFKLAWWIVRDGLSEVRFAIAVLGCLIGSLSVGVLFWKISFLKKAGMTVAIPMIIFIATLIASSAANIAALPYPEDACFGYGRLTIAASLLVFLLPLAIITMLGSIRYTGPILNSNWFKAGNKISEI
jgi:hypothetical protein